MRLSFRDTARGLGLIVVVLIATSACDLEQTGNDEGQREAEITQQEVSAEDAAAARKFWTPERKQQAVPSQPQVVHQGEDPSPPTEPDVPGSGVTPQQREGSLPDTAQGNTYNDLKSLGPIAKDDTMVYDASKVSGSYTQYPFRTVGKVFYQDIDGDLAVCSASVIASENRSVVWTAGHCVANLDVDGANGSSEWHDRWIFEPAYKDGSSPLGEWAARVKVTFEGWFSNRNRNYDLAAVVVERRNGQPITSVTGSLGWLFNAQRNQDWRELGYPVGGDLFGDRKMWQCSAAYVGGGGVGSSPGPQTSAIRDCDMTGGASGGPWVVNFEECPACYINSVNSWGWKRDGHPNLSTQLAGPYHGSAGLDLLRHAEGL